MSAVDVLAVMDRALAHALARAEAINGKSWISQKWGDDMAAARSAVAELIERADNAEKIIRNCVNAGQIGGGYMQHADDLRSTLANVGSPS